MTAHGRQDKICMQKMKDGDKALFVIGWRRVRVHALTRDDLSRLRVYDPFDHTVVFGSIDRTIH